jgi:hypothetical protein
MRVTSQGVYNALMSALLATRAIDRSCSGDDGELHHYGATLKEDFTKYLAIREKYYCRETRWPDSPFWKRRQVRGYQTNAIAAEQFVD